MKGFFVKNKLQKIKVQGDGKTIYYGKEDNGGLIGINTVECADMWIYINENKVRKITFIKNPTAVLHPVNELKKEELFFAFSQQITCAPQYFCALVGRYFAPGHKTALCCRKRPLQGRHAAPCPAALSRSCGR